MRSYLGHGAKRCKVACQLLHSLQQAGCFGVFAPLHGPLQLICSEHRDDAHIQ